MAAKNVLRYFEDLKPDVRAVVEKRVAYHNIISRLLKNNMMDVTESVKEAPKNEQDEEDKKQQDQEKKEEKALYDVPFVYRTIEKRLIQ